MSVERIESEWAARDRNPVAAMTTLPEGFRMTAVPQWIPVSERLPQEYETVLVATDCGVSAGEIRFPDSIDECGTTEPWWMVFKDKRERSPAWAGLVKFASVSHWMPLPAPPTE